MKRLLIASLLILIFANVSIAQLPLTYGVRTTMDLYESNKLVSGNGAGLLTDKDIEGSPFLDEEFKTGSIYTTQKLQYADIQLRYNIYNDNIEFKTPAGEIQALASPDVVEIALIGNNQFVYSSYVHTNKIKKGFLVVMEVGKASLYSKPVVTFKEATQPAAYKQPEPAKFIRKSDEFYVRIGTEPAVFIEGKKDLIAAFPDNQKAIEDYINKNKIKIGKPEGLKKVVNYYNSL
ncbi:MAG TPA: hypothetical protein DER09_12240 [Prolixibacteraceae bacterium]|nr:hypothetical protein [Prolixibacteraceae bacterium]